MSEDMIRAARVIASAAAEFEQAARNIAAALEQHQRFLDDWLTRYQTPIEPEPPAASPGDAPTAGWLDWSGGFAPSQGEVWIKRRDGIMCRAYAGEINWRHYRTQKPSDIMAWQAA